jgi:hypothetical protein
MSTHSAQHSSPRPLQALQGSISYEESAKGGMVTATIQSSKDDWGSLREAITDLYLDVKIRSSDEIDKYNTEEFAKERARLDQLTLMNIIDYIKASIEILMNMKLDENEGMTSGVNTSKEFKMNSKPYFKKGDKPKLNISGTSKASDFEPPKEYEKLIQKLEADVRTHIRVEQQLKLHIETVHNKLEELEDR